MSMENGGCSVLLLILVNGKGFRDQQLPQETHLVRNSVDEVLRDQGTHREHHSFNPIELS